MVEAARTSSISPLDAGPWSLFQKKVVALAALAIVFDGFDNQALGFAIPTMARDWELTPASFAPVAAIGLIGMTVGTAIAGWLGDRLGRRKMLIGSVLIFGLFTLATTLSQGLVSLGILRFLAGLGLGGAMPNAAAIAAEFSPLRNRPLAVTLTIVCVPLGGLLGGLVAAQVLPGFGWKALFLVAGAAPLILAVALWVWLPEFPAFLARDPAKRDQLVCLLDRAGHRSLPESALAADADMTPRSASLRGLFAPDLRRDTIGIWAAFFLCLIAVYTVFNWVPATLSAAGYGSRMSSLGLTGFNLGGVIGAITAAWLIGRLGSRAAMLSLCVVGVLVGTALSVCELNSFGDVGLIVMLSLLGFSINGVQTTMFALAAHLYPSEIRATGVGSALAFGRVGAISSSFLGAAVLASGGGGRFFAVLAVAMAGSFLALALIRNHIAKTDTD